MANYSYEFFTVHTSSLTDNNSTDGNVFTTHLFTPLKDIVQVSVLFANFDASESGSNICYLNCTELSSQFNQITGNVSSSNTMAVSANPIGISKIQNPVAVFNVNGSSRTIYNNQDYTTQTQYLAPIRKLDRITTSLNDKNGDPIILKNNDVFISYRFTCARDNLQPEYFQKKKNHK